MCLSWGGEGKGSRGSQERRREATSTSNIAEPIVELGPDLNDCAHQTPYFVKVMLSQFGLL